MDDQEKIFQLALNMIDGVGFSLWESSLKTFISATNLYQKSKDILLCFYKNNDIVNAILERRYVKESENILLNHKKLGVNVISFFDEEYPSRLKQISNPPCFLYIKGTNNLSQQKIISIIGTRNPSEYGKEIVEMFVRELQEYNVLILSGLAYGIDVLAHKYALKYNIDTSAIIAGGIDRLYPSEHKNIADKIINQGGAIISENKLGTKVDKFLFPARNRIIAGCSDAVLIVEAGQKSGTMITALCANDFNRDVFAIPGNVGNAMSIGCNNLIKNNVAHLVTCVEDIAKIMNWDKDTNKNIDKNENSFTKKYKELDSVSKEIVDLIKDKEGITIDEISLKTNISISQLSSIILMLEFSGIIKNLPGDKYKINYFS